VSGGAPEDGKKDDDNVVELDVRRQQIKAAVAIDSEPEVALEKPLPSENPVSDVFIASLPMRRFKGEPGAKRTGASYRASLDGVASILEQSVVLRYDEARGIVLLMKNPPWDVHGQRPVPREWDKVEQFLCARWIESDFGEDMIRQATIADATNAIVGAARNRFDSVRDAVSFLEWDGITRIGSVSERLGLGTSEKSIAIVTSWLIASIRRAFEPGKSLNEVLFIEEARDIRAHVSALSSLVPHELFVDYGFDLDYRSSASALVGSMLVVVSDVSTLSEHMLGVFASFAGRGQDKGLPARRCGFALVSSERVGKKPPRCGVVQAVGMPAPFEEEERLQVLAESVELMKQVPVRSGPPESERERLADPWEGPVRMFLEENAEKIEERGFVTIPQILRKCVRMPMERWNAGSDRRIARILRSAKFFLVRPRVNGIQFRAWAPPCLQGFPQPLDDDKAEKANNINDETDETHVT
jgi:virulence-associated protein E